MNGEKGTQKIVQLLSFSLVLYNKTQFYLCGFWRVANIFFIFLKTFVQQIFNFEICRLNKLFFWLHIDEIRWHTFIWSVKLSLSIYGVFY